MRRIETWFGLRTDDLPADLFVIGCPFEEPASHQAGASAGPDAIRRWSRTSEAVTEEGTVVELRVHDDGNVRADDGKRSGRWDTILARAQAAWLEHPDAFGLGLGGDHSVTPPLLAAAMTRHPDLCFVMIDAHPDAFLSYDGEPDSHASVLPVIWNRAGLAPQATAVLGVRSFAPEELEMLHRAGTVIPAREWHTIGTDAVADRVTGVAGGRPVYLSIDLDGLDPAAAPGVAYPVPGGPDTRAVLELLQALWARLDIVAADVVELTPRLDTPSGTTAALAAHLCLQVFGHVAARQS